MLQVQDNILPARRGLGELQIIVIRRSYLGIVEVIASGESRRRREVVVDLSDHIFLIAEPGSAEDKLSSVAGHGSVWQRVEREVGQDFGIDRDLRGGCASSVCAQNTVVSVSR